MSEDDRRYMGSPEDAKSALMDKAREWKELRQPLIASATEQRKRTVRDQQVRFELANAALLWLWHEEHPV